MLSPEGHRNRQGAAPLIHILNDLIVREASRAAMDIAQRQIGVVTRRVTHHQLSQELKFLPARQPRP